MFIPDFFQRLRTLGTASPTFAPVVAAELASWLDTRSIVVVRSIERALREPRHAALRAGCLPLPPWLNHPVAIGVSSCQRDGFARQAAVEALGTQDGKWTVAFLFNRLNDPVPTVRLAAEEQLIRRFTVDPLPVLVAVLPLLHAASAMKHVHAGTWLTRLAQRPGVDAVVARAMAAGDPELRVSAIRWTFGRSTPTTATLRALLSDPDPRIRERAARAVLNGPSRDALLPVLLASPSRHTRLWALQGMSRSPDALRPFVLDRAANNRFHVRSWLQKAAVVVDYRQLALQALQGPRADWLGALGLLAETGRVEDLGLVEALCHDDQARVRREARRTLRILQSTC
jgi:HEAT repeat protein